MILYMSVSFVEPPLSLSSRACRRKALSVLQLGSQSEAFFWVGISDSFVCIFNSSGLPESLTISEPESLLSLHIKEGEEELTAVTAGWKKVLLNIFH